MMKRCILPSLFLVIILNLILSCSDEDMVVLQPDDEVNISLTAQPDVLDTGKVYVDAILQTSIQDVSFEKVGFLYKEGNATTWDTLKIGSNFTANTFKSTINSLKRDKSYDFAAYAKRENFLTKVSDQVTIWTRAFLLDSLRELQSLPGDSTAKDLVV